MDQSVLTFLVLLAVVTFALRWIAGGSARPLDHQTIRYLFLQRLQLACQALTVCAVEEHMIAVQIGERQCTVMLDQLYRRCATYPLQVHAITRMAVESICNALNLPEDASDTWLRHTVTQIVRADSPLPPDLVVRPLHGPLALGYVVNGEGAFRWITRQDLEAAGIDEDRLHTVAQANLERSYNRLEIETLGVWPDGHERLLRFTTNDGLDAARVLVPSFFQRYSPRFGDTDLLVAIPTRDTLVMVSTRDESHAGLLEWRSRHERAQQAYPLHDTLLAISEHGIEAWQREATDQATTA